MELNYNLEKTINHYRQNILCNTQLADIGLVDNNNRIELVLSSLINLRDLLILHESAKALTSLKVIKNDKAINNCFNEAQYQVIEATILFYQNNPELNYPTDYPSEPEQPETSFKQLEPQSQNIEQVGLDKLTSEILELKTMQFDLLKTTKENRDKQTKNVEVEQSSIVTDIKKLTELVEEIKPDLKRFSEASEHSESLQNIMIANAKETLKIADDQTKSMRGTFKLSIAEDTAEMRNGIKAEVANVNTALKNNLAEVKAELKLVSMQLIEDFTTVNKQHYQEFSTASKKIFESQSATIEQYLSKEHNYATNIAELQKSHEVSKITWGWFFSGLIVVLLLVNFFTVIYMKNNISTTTSTNVVNAIKQIRDAQIKSSPPPAITNHKKY